MLSLRRLDHLQTTICELFSNCVQEYAHRFAIWLDNVEFIHSFNEEGKSFWVSLKSPSLELHIARTLPKFVIAAAARPQPLC